MESQFFFVIFLFTGILTLVETMSALSFIWGGYALAIDRKIFGWIFLIVAHIATAISSFYIGKQFIFAGLQIISTIVCLYALVYSYRYASKEFVRKS